MSSVWLTKHKEGVWLCCVEQSLELVRERACCCLFGIDLRSDDRCSLFGVSGPGQEV